MENAIVYQSQAGAETEIREYFLSRGLRVSVLHSRSELICIEDKGTFSRVFLEVRNLSDIPLMSMVRELFSAAEIVLIASEPLKHILEIIKQNNYQIIEEIANIKQSQETS